MTNSFRWTNRTGADRRPDAGRRAAFTLIELLAVIGIIALVAALLLPTLGRAHEKSRTASCLQNLKSLGVALTLYSGDHDGWIPTYAIQQSTLVPEVLTYMSSKSKTRSAWMCPSDRKIKERATLISFTSNPDEQYFYSYGFLEMFLPRCSTLASCTPYYIQTNNFPILRSVVEHPSLSVFLSDGGWWRIVNNSVSFRHQRVQFRHGRPASMDGMETESRDGLLGNLGYDTKGDFKSATANLFYYDGHATSMNYAQYCSNLNAFIAAGYNDRSTPQIPTSEFQ